LENLEEGLFTKVFERRISFVLSGDHVCWSIRENVKEDCGNGQLCLHRDPFEERGRGGGHFIRDIEMQMI